MSWNLYNPMFEEEIQTFGEGKAPKVTPDDLNEAEIETKEKEKDAKDTQEEKDEAKEEKEMEIEGEDTPEETEDSEEFEEVSPEDTKNADDYSDEELGTMSYRQLRQIRFTPFFEYGTPAGADNPASHSSSGCSNCGNADAGDVAIIDAEIAPGNTEQTTADEIGGDEIPSGGQDAMPGEDAGGEEESGLGEEVEMYYKERNRPSYFSAFNIPGTEDYDQGFGPGGSETLANQSANAVARALKWIIVKAAKFARKTYLFVRNKISQVFMRRTTVHKLWKFKLGMNLKHVKDERLDELETEAYPYDVWIEAAKVSLMAYDLVATGDRIIFDQSKDTTVSMMKQFNNKLDEIGIQLSAGKRRIIMDSFMDQRKHDSVLKLGFTKSQMPNCLRYFDEIAKRFPKGENPLEKKLQDFMHKSNAFAASVNEKLEKGEISKNSPEYKEGSDTVMRHTVRIDFLMVTMKLATILFDQLTADALRIFSRYEDATASKSLVD